MKKKKLNIIKLLLVNIIILLVFIVMLLIAPNYYKYNAIICFSYIVISLLFNMFITEK